ncbi:MAG TPA: HNH endonuclease [Candidatus Limnocylindrales bacterium]|nr:HNH endonuclease [Candidatus Limnocylindrales bacterium]
MTFADVTREAVLAATARFDELGRERFLSEYGFGPAKAYFLEYNGRLYDSKAIFGYAHGVSGEQPWRAQEFTGGDRTVAERLRKLGFTVIYLRNPEWTRDEIILVCAAVAANGWITLPAESSTAIELSLILQSPAIHPLESRRSDFRNPAGVELKSRDLMSHHPATAGAPRLGNRLVPQVVHDFLEKPNQMQALAQSIHNVLLTWEDATLHVTDIDDYQSLEGGVLLKAHLRRERDPKLKSRKIQEAKSRGLTLACQVCGFDFETTYGPHGVGYIECHHRTPLGVSGEVHTRLADLALICSNCHRMIHRSKDWLTVEELKELVDRNRVTFV